MSALICFALAALIGFALMCGGVWLLAGTGWALVAGAISMFCIAGFIRRGMTGG